MSDLNCKSVKENEATVISPMEPTHILDFAILKNLKSGEHCEIGTINERISDHNPILMNMSGA